MPRAKVVPKNVENGSSTENTSSKVVNKGRGRKKATNVVANVVAEPTKTELNVVDGDGVENGLAVAEIPTKKPKGRAKKPQQQIIDEEELSVPSPPPPQSELVKKTKGRGAKKATENGKSANDEIEISENVVAKPKGRGKKAAVAEVVVAKEDVIVEQLEKKKTAFYDDNHGEDDDDNDVNDDDDSDEDWTGASKKKKRGAGVKKPQIKTKEKVKEATIKEPKKATKRGAKATKIVAANAIENLAEISNEEIAVPKKRIKKALPTTNGNDDNDNDDDIEEKVAAVEVVGKIKKKSPTKAKPGKRGKKVVEQPKHIEEEEEEEEEENEGKKEEKQDEKMKQDDEEEEEKEDGNESSSSSANIPKASLKAKVEKKTAGRKRAHVKKIETAAEEIQDEDAQDGGLTAAKVKKSSAGAPMNSIVTNYKKSDFDCIPPPEGRVSDSGKLFNMKISSWNVAGLRAWITKGGLEFLDFEIPDIFCLQEIKCSKDQLPEAAINIPGYHPYWFGTTTGHGGVAIYTKIMPINVQYGIDNAEIDDVGRMITAEYEKFYLINVYVPNSGRKLVNLAVRMKWEDEFRKFVKNLDSKKAVIICGDMNVSHQPIDLANPKTNTKNAGFTKEERDKMSELLAIGFIDSFRHLYPERKDAYTFWTYMGNARRRNVGWRLDYFIISERWIHSVVDNCIRSQVMGSDHCPITLFLKI